MKTIWQHRNGHLYTTWHDTFGHIVAVAGPIDWTLPEDAAESRDDAASIAWAEHEINHRLMHKLTGAMV